MSAQHQTQNVQRPARPTMPSLADMAGTELRAYGERLGRVIDAVLARPAVSGVGVSRG